MEATACCDATLRPHDCGLPRTGTTSEAKEEAYAFAVLGFLSVHDVAGMVPTSTGAERATVLGSVSFEIAT
jgi:anhydro-N-acetylmuramic acid kinase